jgi:hypothetical protein
LFRWNRGSEMEFNIKKTAVIALQICFAGKYFRCRKTYNRILQINPQQAAAFQSQGCLSWLAGKLPDGVRKTVAAK